MYLTYAEYLTYSDVITDENVFNKIEKKQERNINVLTFNRIEDFSKLSSYNQELIKEVLSEMCDFYYSNKDYIEAYINSYSINGVSIDFNSKNLSVVVKNGIQLPASTYSKLTTSNLAQLVL